MTIAEATTRLRGSIACAAIAFWAGDAPHPDLGRPIGVSGTFDVAFVR